MDKTVQIEDTAKIVAARAHYHCEACGRQTPLTAGQLAHRVPQTERYLKLYGPERIHHPLNLAWTCSLECNGRMDLRHRPLQLRDKLMEIDWALGRIV